MINRKIVDEVAEEWWTGLDPNGKKSKKAQWFERGPFGAMVSHNIEWLRAMLTKRMPGHGLVRVRFAMGIDGDPDIRIELEESGRIDVHRWRPSKGDLKSDVADGGRCWDTRFVLHSKELREALASIAIKEQSQWSVTDVRLAISGLKLKRRDIQDQLEAIGNGHDRNAVERDLSDLDQAIANAQAINDRLNLERKAKTAETEAAGV